MLTDLMSTGVWNWSCVGIFVYELTNSWHIKEEKWSMCIDLNIFINFQHEDFSANCILKFIYQQKGEIMILLVTLWILKVNKTYIAEESFNILCETCPYFVILWLCAKLCNSWHYIPIVRPNRCTCFTNLFILSNTLHVSDSLSIHHQELKTVHTATGICETDTVACCCMYIL